MQLTKEDALTFDTYLRLKGPTACVEQILRWELGRLKRLHIRLGLSLGTDPKKKAHPNFILNRLHVIEAIHVAPESEGGSYTPTTDLLEGLSRRRLEELYGKAPWPIEAQLRTVEDRKPRHYFVYVMVGLSYQTIELLECWR